MRILFVSYGDLSLDAADSRSVSMLIALADSGHQVDVIAGSIELKEHPSVRVLTDSGTLHNPRKAVRKALRQAVRAGKYDLIHAIDDAVFPSFRSARFRKLKVVYDARRCFSGKYAQVDTIAAKLFPHILAAREQKILASVSAVVVPCPVLQADLEVVQKEAAITVVEDVPRQFVSVQPSVQDRRAFLAERGWSGSMLVACSVGKAETDPCSGIVKMIRKVVESAPKTAFIIRGCNPDKAGAMAEKMEIADRCRFLPDGAVDDFLAALDVADAALLVPGRGGRYTDPSTFTFLQSPGPIIIVQSGSDDSVLNERNSILIEPTSSAMAEALLRLIREPLFSLGLATAGRQLVADHYSLSSFKYKIRMLYHDVLKKH
jgi:glycosyltransferase involved in cell wall biosynthesis